MKRRLWTAAEVEYLKLHFADTPTKDIATYLNRSYSSVAQRARTEGLKKSEAFQNDLVKSGKINLITHGKDSRFQKGHAPHNKGRSQEEYMSTEAIAKTKATRFQEGQLPHNTREDGAISIRTCKGKWPYKWIRLSVGNWQLLHRVLWEEAHGAIPEGYNVQFKDGNTLNCVIDNLELVKRGENMKRNTIHRYPGEVKQAIRQLSKLKKAINHATE